PAHSKGYVDVRVEDIWGFSKTLPNAFEFNDGTFTDQTGTRAPANSSSSDFLANAMAIGDVDGDDLADLVLGRAAGGVGRSAVLLLNDENNPGSFRYDSTQNFDRYDVDAAALGDLDGDEDLDLVVTRTGYYQYPYGNYVYRVYTWVYKWAYSSTRIFINEDGDFSLSPYAVFDPVKAPRNTDLMQGVALALGDLDGKNELDIVVTRDLNVATSDYKNNTWGYKTFYIYYNENTPATRVLLNNGDATFKNVTKTAIPVVTDGDMFAGDDVAVGDVDGDSYPDIVVTGDGSYLRDSTKPEYVQGSKTRILINQGDGTFEDETSSMFPGVKTGDDWGGEAVALGDLDGDDIDDVVITKSQPVFYTKGDGTKVYMTSTRVFLGGSSSLTDKTSTYIPAVRTDGNGEMWRGVDVAIADPDGDGNTDIFVLDRSEVLVQDPGSGAFTKKISSLRWLFNEGTPFTDLTAKGMPDPESTGDYYLGDVLLLGDVDDDNDLDMIVGTTLSAYAGDGDRPLRVLEFR
ncbi:MAG: FG-GAP repeat domain-containing protein, partial [Planctomycetota bacterium]